MIEKLNPIFCLEIIEQYIGLIDPTEVNQPGRSQSSPIRRTDRLISVLRRSCANLKSVRMIECRLKILSGKPIRTFRSSTNRILGNLEEAEEILNQLNNSNPESVEVYILLAELEIKRKNSSAAKRQIESAVAIKFDIQNTSYYQDWFHSTHNVIMTSQ